MSKNKSTAIQKLIAKRAKLDADIAAAELQEKRKIEILALPEFIAILHLSEPEIRAGLKKWLIILYQSRR